MSSVRADHEAALARAETALAADPRAMVPLFERAQALDALGRNDAARQAYLTVLSADLKHREALLGLAALCTRLGQKSAAKTALQQAVRVSPELAVAHSNLATILHDSGEEAEARRHYEEALRLDPDNRGAHKGMAIVLLREGALEAARAHGVKGFGGVAEAWPYRGEGPPIALLLVVSALGGNIPIDSLIDDRVFLKWTILPEFFDPLSELPPHDLVFNAIGDADRCAASLKAAESVLARSHAPVLNPPARVLATARAANAARLGQIPGVVTAHTATWSRAEASRPEATNVLAGLGFGWPLLLRSPGFHNGQHFVKIDRPEDFNDAVRALPGDELLVLQFVDTRGPDGNFRKYRVMLIDGHLYPLHLAISARWKVHYLSADMAERPEHRDEDRAFLEDMPGVLGPTTMHTLERIRDCLGVDYGGLDLGLDAHGNVVVFEANTTMIILPPAEDPRWTYRIAPVERVQEAVRQMLVTRAARSPEPG